MVETPLNYEEMSIPTSEHQRTEATMFQDGDGLDLHAVSGPNIAPYHKTPGAIGQTALIEQPRTHEQIVGPTDYLKAYSRAVNQMRTAEQQDAA